MNLLPFRFSRVGNEILFSNEAGDFFFSNERTLDRLALGHATLADMSFLKARGFAYDSIDDFYVGSFVDRLTIRKALPASASYLIVVPTLRCDLACTYCQVSRAAIGAHGYDWSDETLQQFLDFLDTLPREQIQIEFQGGEPTLRLDLLERVMQACEERFLQSRFVICTHLRNLDEKLIQLLERHDLSISTSIDGPVDIHTRNRTGAASVTRKVMENVRLVIDRFGLERLSALPTIAHEDYGRITEIVDQYVELGLASIYLRPVNYQGFARKRHPGSVADENAWFDAYQAAIRHIFEHNRTSEHKITEFTLELALKRIFRAGENGHVDLRSPNPPARDYLVVDYDGRLYPSDEARMVTRIGLADLAIGDLKGGLDRQKVEWLGWNQMNDVHETCQHCVFQPYCGIDVVDDLARYGRIDGIKEDSHFCRTNTDLFSLVFSMLRDSDPGVQFNLKGHLLGSFDHTPFMAPSVYDPPEP